MELVYLGIYLLVLIAAAVCGWSASKMSSRRFGLCLFGAAAVICLRALLYARPEYEQHLLFLWNDYVYFAEWSGPAAMLVVFAMAGRLEGVRVRRAVGAVLILIAPVFFWETAAVCLRPSYGMPARFDENEVCLQSTSHSCGPAAAVTLLHSMGKSVSEGEMANLTLLRPGQGVTALELTRGLNVALRSAGWRARIDRLNEQELAWQRRPFMAELRRPGGRFHCVVVRKVHSDSVVVADPAYGEKVVDMAGFLSEWTGITITAVPSAGRRATLARVLH